jgi:hypothetical protein
MALKYKKKTLRKQTNTRFNMGNVAENFFLCQKLKSRVSSFQLKPILDIFMFGFSLSRCPQHGLKVLFLPNAMCPFTASTQL